MELQTNLEQSRFFDFEKNKVQPITIEQLERTFKENDVYGNPLRGIHHFEFINRVIDIAKEFDYTLELYDMFAAQNRDKYTPGVVILPQIEEKFGPRAIEAHILRRVYANIRIKDFDTDELTTNMAIAFHQRGIQVGFGNNVIICHNQCMLMPTNYVATYGNGRDKSVSIEDVFEVIKSWLFDARGIIVAEREKIDTMKSIECSMEQVFQLIGMMTAMRVSADTNIKSIKSNDEYPLSQAQISRFTEQLLVIHNKQSHLNVWDIYNAATNLYKPQMVEIPSIMPQNRRLVNLLNDFFEI
jgi:hypothetical protein